MDSESEAIKELMSMSVAELDLVQHEVIKWVCSGKGCCRGTKIRDYGIGGVYWHPRKSIAWFNIGEYYWMCEKHLKIFKRLIKSYPIDKVEQKLFDFEKQKLQR